MITNRLFAGALFAATALTAAAPASAQRIDRIVAFGDSYADDGNFFALAGINPATTVAYTTGRFSGGTNYIDTLGTILNAPIDNFAIGGARTGISNQSNPVNWGFTYEVDQFLGVGTQSTAFPTTSSFGANDLLAVSIGGNDSRAYQLGGGTVAGAPASAAVAAAQATANLNRLVAAGAPTISFLAGDTGQLPEVSFQANPALAASVRTAYSTSFNTAIQSTLSGYAAGGTTVHYLDLTRVLDNVRSDFAAYGLSALACPAFPVPLGPGVPGSTACLSGDTSTFLVYGDQLHLTSAGFAIVARYVAAQLTAPLTLRAPSEVAMDTATQFGRTLTTRMDLGSPRDGDMPEGVAVFLVGDSISRTLEASRSNDQFKVTSVGLTGGVEFGFGSGLIGAAVNVSRPKANFFNDAARDEAKAVQLGVYGGFGLAGGFVQGYAGIGRDRHDLTRQGVVSQMDADTKGRHTVAGIKAGYLMPVAGVRVGPVVALDHANVRVNGYTEDGDSALTLNVGRHRFTSLRGSVGGEVRGDFGDDGLSVRPYFAAMIEKDFGDDERTFEYSQTSAPTIVNSFRIETDNKAYGRLSAGLSATILSGVSVNANLSGTIGRDDANETSGHLGLRAGF